MPINNRAKHFCSVRKTINLPSGLSGGTDSTPFKRKASLKAITRRQPRGEGIGAAGVQ